MTKAKDFYNTNPIYPDSPRGLGNDHWVCFDCRISVRLRKGINHKANCRQCGKPLHGCGSKVKLPAKSKIKEWKALERRFGNDSNTPSSIKNT